MDNELSSNDPYRQMESGEDGIQPDFLKSKSGAAQNALGAVEQAANAVMAAKGGGKAPANTGGLASKAGQSGEKGAFDELKGKKSGASSAEKAEAGESSPDGLYSKKNEPNSNTNGEGGENEPSLKIPTSLKMASPIILILLGVFGLIFLIVAMPVLMIGALDANLQKALGFTNTVGILEEQGEYVTSELMAEGKMPTGYASDLASNGVLVGQVAEDGRFIRTDTYIANILERDDLVAAEGQYYYNSDEEGELALLYNGDVIRANEFVAAVESDPTLYAAYSKAADISVKYYYGKDVKKVYNEMKLSRGNFNNWVETGDYKTDENSFNGIMEKVLNNNSDLVVGGVHQDVTPLFDISAYIPDWNDDMKEGGTYSENITEESAEDIVKNVTDKTRDYVIDWVQETRQVTETYEENGVEKERTVNKNFQVPVASGDATKRAAELLNTAVSAGEPYLASSSFIAVEEPIQRARIDGDGPVNHLMNALSSPSKVSYIDVASGKEVTKKLSILETSNFRAAVSDSPYSKDEAASFARDRVLQVTGQADKETIKKTTVYSDGRPESSAVVRNGHWTKANEDATKKATDSMSMAVEQKNSDLFRSVVGGNRVIEGGSFLSNNINKKVIGAMPSDSSAIAAYQKEVDTVMARKAEADRATLSPFDISSPYTFLGSIVNNFASSMLGTYGNGFSVLTAMRATGDATGGALASLLGTASAEGADQTFTTLSPNNCETVNTIKVEGDLYCSSHNTVSTKYVEYTIDDWKNSNVGLSLDDNGGIVEKSELEKFMVMGMDRESTVGIKDGDVCEAWHGYEDSAFQKVGNFFTSLVGLYHACDKVDDGVADGAAYSFTSGHTGDLELYSGYMLYSQVRSLLEDTDSKVSMARDRYYAKHPKDDSRAGVIARISGMEKWEAELALAYNDYLTTIANYDASNRYAFSDLELNIEKPILTAHRDAVMENLYAWHREEIEYGDARNREVAMA